jgi:adenosylhomocysteinase
VKPPSIQFPDKAFHRMDENPNFGRRLPDPKPYINAEFHIVFSIIRRLLEEGKTDKCSKIAARCIGVSEETEAGIRGLFQMEREGSLLFPVINVNDSVTKAKFESLYGCKYSLCDSIIRASDVHLAGRKVVVCGYGDVGKACAAAMRAHGAAVFVTEVDPICALQCCMEGYLVVTLEDMAPTVDLVITATGNTNVVTAADMEKMKDNAVVGNIGHYGNEIDMEGLLKVATRSNLKPQVDKYTFPSGRGVIVLAEGHLLNTRSSTQPSFMIS